MPTYEIQRFEVHCLTYRVQAITEAEAVVKLLDGKAEPVNRSLRFVAAAEDRGMPADDYPSMARVLQDRGIVIRDFIPSIRSIELVWPRSLRTPPETRKCVSRERKNLVSSSTAESSGAA